jgi:hypothetical protein
VASIESFPPNLSLHLGDIVSNLRQSLDHATWAMVQRGTRASSLNPQQESSVQYPYTYSRSHFNNVIPNRLPGATRSDIAVVRAFQPFARPVRRHTLGNLATFSNEDKHRTIKPILALPDAAQFTANCIRDCHSPRVSAPRKRVGPLQVGSELGRIYVKKVGPDPMIETTGTLDAKLAINDKFLLDQWWSATCQAVGDFLARLESPPFAWDATIPVWVLPPPDGHPGSPPRALFTP